MNNKNVNIDASELIAILTSFVTLVYKIIGVFNADKTND